MPDIELDAAEEMKQLLNAKRERDNEVREFIERQRDIAWIANALADHAAKEFNEHPIAEKDLP